MLDVKSSRISPLAGATKRYISPSLPAVIVSFITRLSVGSSVTIPKISLVIPIYNEESVLDALFARLKRSLADLPDTEILFVNDGSTDDSLNRLTRFLEEVPEARIVNLSRNFGHQSALMAGIAHARGEAVILMDGDLQDPPEVLPQMIEKWNRGAEIIVAAVRNGRQIVEAAVTGADIVTAGFAVYEAAFDYPYTHVGLAKFQSFWDQTPYE